jgi:hypothetical protein
MNRELELERMLVRTDKRNKDAISHAWHSIAFRWVRLGLSPGTGTVESKLKLADTYVNSGISMR